MSPPGTRGGAFLAVVLFAASCAGPSTGIRLHLGCGSRLEPGWLNVDAELPPNKLLTEVGSFRGSEDMQTLSDAVATSPIPVFLRHDLEHTPWPFPTSSATSIKMVHVLEHLGQTPSVFLAIAQELYRVAAPNATLLVVVPHHRHVTFFSDPTHVRAVTGETFRLFSRLQGLSNAVTTDRVADSPLALRLNVDLRPQFVHLRPTRAWRQMLRPSWPATDDLLTNDQINTLQLDSEMYGGVVSETTIVVAAVKPLIPAHHPAVAAFPFGGRLLDVAVRVERCTFDDHPPFRLLVEMLEPTTCTFILNPFIHIEVALMGDAASRRNMTVSLETALLWTREPVLVDPRLPVPLGNTSVVVVVAWTLLTGTHPFSAQPPITKTASFELTADVDVPPAGVI